MQTDDKRTEIEKIADAMKMKSAERLGKFYQLQDRTRRAKLINTQRPGKPDPNWHMHKLGLKFSKRKGRYSNFPACRDKFNARVKAITGLVKLIARVGATKEQIEEWDTPTVVIEPLPRDSSKESGSN